MYIGLSAAVENADVIGRRTLAHPGHPRLQHRHVRVPMRTNSRGVASIVTDALRWRRYDAFENNP